MANETYVFDGIEVRKTGRNATRWSSHASTHRNVTHTLVEITPVDTTMKWNKWVRETDLYVVKEN